MRECFVVFERQPELLKTTLNVREKMLRMHLKSLDGWAGDQLENR
jgi:biotin synthase-related radical SAM superfamily protein